MPCGSTTRLLAGDELGRELRKPCCCVAEERSCECESVFTHSSLPILTRHVTLVLMLLPVVVFVSLAFPGVTLCG